METYLELRGVVNGEPVEAAGMGRVGAELTIQVGRVPLGWDPALALPSWADGIALALNVARGRGADGPPLLARSYQVLFAEGGRELGRAVVALVGHRDGDVLEFRAQLVEAESRLEPLEEIVELGRADVGIQGEVVASVWSARTNRGHDYALLSTTVGEVGGAAPGRRLARERLQGATRVTLELGEGLPLR